MACYVFGFFLCWADSIVMILHYREVGDICYIFHHGATIYGFYFVMVSYWDMSVLSNLDL